MKSLRLKVFWYVRLENDIFDKNQQNIVCFTNTHCNHFHMFRYHWKVMYQRIIKGYPKVPFIPLRNYLQSHRTKATAKLWLPLVSSFQKRLYPHQRCILSVVIHSFPIVWYGWSSCIRPTDEMPVSIGIQIHSTILPIMGRWNTTLDPPNKQKPYSNAFRIYHIYYHPSFLYRK